MRIPSARAAGSARVFLERAMACAGDKGVRHKEIAAWLKAHGGLDNVPAADLPPDVELTADDFDAPRE